MAREKVLIVVKTYPTLSNKYGETVCTAGFRQDGSWIRIYPVPFRKFDEYQRYKKFQWIELELVRNTTDNRVESYRPSSEITLLEEMGTTNRWYERRDFVLNKGKVYSNFAEIIQKNKDGELSLATFKPTKIVGVKVEPTDRNWDKQKMETINAKNKQLDLFEGPKVDFKVVRKLPYKFIYEFEDDKGQLSRMMIEDWEIGMLYWNVFDKHHSEERAVEDVKSKYMNDLVKERDIHLFLGTTHRWDAIAPNPFVIIGVFSPPEVRQTELLL